MNNFGIFGFGRFGALWAQLLSTEGEVYVFESSVEKRIFDNKHIHFCESAEEVFEKSTVIFYAVPISVFEEVLISHMRFISERHVVADLLSVKLHAKEIFEKYLPNGVEALLLHPMFGPDSVRLNGTQNLPIVVDKFRASLANYQKITNLFKKFQWRVIEMTADEHDRMAARSQGVAHFLGRVLAEFGLETTPIDTLGAKKLHDVMELSCNDTFQLFTDLQSKNPYTKQMRQELRDAFEKLSKKLTL
jgi:prephenate dehydrogenase